MFSKRGNGSKGNNAFFCDGLYQSVSYKLVLFTKHPSSFYLLLEWQPVVFTIAAVLFITIAVLHGTTVKAA